MWLPFDLREFIMNIDEYEVYARERRLKSKIACCLDKCMKEENS